MTLLQTLEVPEYITQVQLSKKRRNKYYRKKKGGKWYPRDLPTTFAEKLDAGEWTLDKNGYLLEEDGQKKLANPGSAGTPKYQTLSGNDFMSGHGSHHIRRKLTNELKDFYTPFVKKMRPFEPKELPITVTWDFYTIIGEANWDMDNMFFYWKYFQDVLVKQKIIPDDTIQYITHPPSARFCPVDKWEDRKFVFTFLSDERRTIRKKFEQHNLLLL